MKPATGATPLFALEALAFDTETTGLDPASARIVQIGAVRISKGVVLPDTGYERIVDPGVPIPAKSTQIHGIGNADARMAPDLAKVWSEMRSQISNRVVVGHSIGFDFAVLSAEAQRHGLKWDKPRGLCVRMLAQLVAPSLADHSLDALAGWLGLTIRNRHQALGDALAAADVFVALVPKLREHGIETLAQLERALLRLQPEIERHQSAGWTMPVAQPQAQAVAGFDSLAYRHTVGEVMAKPVAVVSPATTLKQAMDLMVARAISSVFVADPAEPALDMGEYAILTERDLMRRISRDGSGAFDTPCSQVASKPVMSIRENAFVYRAVGRMARLKYRHLAVRDDANRLQGIVSARDLLKVRAGPALILDDGIEGARTADELAAAWATLPAVVNALIAEDTDARIVCRVVSEEIRSITRRAAVIAEAAMLTAGKGKPPCSYCVLVLGSGGRGESMLVPDQDNAIVFAEGEPDGENDRWFAKMAKLMADELNTAGIPYCKGGIMAKNSAWRGSMEDWRARVDAWIGKSTPDDILNVDIFFDAMPVHGDMRMGNELFEYAYARGKENAGFAKLLGESLGSIPHPVTLFGAIRTDDGDRLDLKKSVLFPIAALARTLAIRHGFTRRATPDRLAALKEAGIGPERDITALAQAHRLALEMVLAQQASDIESGLKPGNFVAMSPLPRSRKAELKQALSDVQLIPTLVRDMMFVHA